MKMEMSFPPIDKVLLDALNEMFPEKSADLKWDMKKVWHSAGQRDVVRFLNSKYEEQQEE